MKILIAFDRKIIVREEVIGSYTGDCHFPTLSLQARTSSLIVRLTKASLTNAKSFTYVTLKPNSKLHRIDDSACAKSSLTSVHIPSFLEVLCKFCFSPCNSLTSVTFEPNSKLQRIDESAFAERVLSSIQILLFVEVLCKSCFSSCDRVASITFESNSKRREVAADSFAPSPGLQPIEYPPSLLKRSQAVISRAAPAPSSSIAGGD
jgi:hypothetical protein